MDLDNLQAFIAVAEQASFSRAAEQLFLTQPAVSRRIAALEDELNTHLFDRIGHKISLTEAGRALMPRARHILEAVDDSRRAVANLSGKVAGILPVGTSHHIGLHRLPAVLRNYSKAYPDVELDLRFMDSEAACMAVEHGDLELGIVTLPLTPSANLTTTPVWADPLEIVVSREHELAHCAHPGPKVLADFPAVLPARGTYTREVIERAFEQFGVRLSVKLSTNYLETIRMLVTVGLGWSILPHTMLGEELKVIKLPGLCMERTLGVVNHRSRTLSNAATALMEMLAALSRGAV
jgi:DNA-binding transcriptional LysR family regulator